MMWLLLTAPLGFAQDLAFCLDEDLDYVGIPKNELAQDLNCNGIEASEEEAVDLGDPLCAEQIDPATGLPFPNADYYVEYKAFGCEYPVINNDADGDGLGGGQIQIPPDAKVP
ncbi:MAG: hypothetical protein AAFV53_34110, partial [Myxococcota bacterium]